MADNAPDSPAVGLDLDGPAPGSKPSADEPSLMAPSTEAVHPAEESRESAGGAGENTSVPRGSRAGSDGGAEAGTEAGAAAESAGERSVVEEAAVEVGEGDIVRIGGREVRVGQTSSPSPSAGSKAARDGAGGEADGGGDGAGGGAGAGADGDDDAGAQDRLPKYYNEDAQHPNWVTHNKHILIFSAAGKPIFSRYGNESKLSGTTCVLQAFVSFVEDQGDELQSFVAGQHRFVFLLRGSVYLVAISRTEEPVFYLRRQLAYLYDQILFLLTSGVKKVFKSNPSFDLRSLLGGTESMFTSLIHLTNINPSFLLGSVRCLSLPPSVRADVAQVLHANHAPDMLYSILVARHQLVSLVRPKRHQLHTDDLLLILNMVNASSTFKQSDSWTPLCLPAFNDRGFLHAHVSYLAEDVCLLLVTTKDDQFPVLQGFKENIAAQLKANRSLDAIGRALRTTFTCESLGVPGIRHFLYKASTCQYVAPAHTAPYNTYAEEKRLYRLYQQVYDRVHYQAPRPHKVYFLGTQTESILAWVSKDFELYATFGPFMSKAGAVTASNQLLKAIRQHEENLFILHAPVWT